MNRTIELLKTRRSAPPAALCGPGPSAHEIDALMEIAARVPDHGKLAPWRFIVFEGEARERAGEIIADVYAGLHAEADAPRVEAERMRLSHAPLVVAVVSRAAPHAENPGMGAGFVRRRRVHESRGGGECAWLRLGVAHRMVCV